LYKFIIPSSGKTKLNGLFNSFYYQFLLANIPQYQNIEVMKTVTQLPDRQLINLYLDGDPQAFSTLVHRYKDRIYTSIYLLVKDKYLAEDIFQDSFIRIIDTLQSGK